MDGSTGNGDFNWILGVAQPIKPDRREMTTIASHVAGPAVSPSSAASPTSIDIFLHIPKTAGTSIRKALLGHYPPSETALVYQGHELGMREADLGALPLPERQRLRLVYGHCSYGIHAKLGGLAQYSMFLREPAARLRSNVGHHVAAQAVFRYARRPVTLCRVVNEGLSPEFDNLAVRLVSGVREQQRPPGSICREDVELALHNVREHFQVRRSMRDDGG